MGSRFNKAAMTKGVSRQQELQVARDEAPELPYVNWRKDPGLRKLYMYCIVICVASATTGYDGSMLNNIRLIPQFETYFHNPEGSNLGLLTALYSIGSIASLPFVPFLCDRFGRKLAIIIGCIIMIIAAVVQVCAQNLAMFKGARFLMGFGNSLAQLSSPLLLTELCHPQHRGRVTAIYNCLWNVGFIINTWLSFGTQHIQSTWSWRLPTLLQGLPSAIQLAFIWFIPESPRWLIAQDRSDEALAILARYHANGNDQDPVVAWEFAEIKETLRLEFLYKKTSTYLDFLKTKGNRYRLLLIASLGLFSQWSGNGLISYYSANVYESIGITNPTTQLGINGGQSILSLIVSVTCAMFVDKFGRRPFFLVSTAGMLLCFMSWTICAAYYVKGNVAAGKATLVFIWLFNVSYALAWSGLLVAYTVEILPYKLRAKGLMIMNFFVQVALVINQYVNPYGFDDLHPQYKLYVIYTCWIAFELVFVYFLYIETKGVPLEEIAKIFDGENAEVGIAEKNIEVASTTGVEVAEKDQGQVHMSERTERV